MSSPLPTPSDTVTVSQPARETFPLDFTVKRALTMDPVGSPCTNICRLDTATRTYCVGCHRTRTEIKSWKTLNNLEKRAVIRTLLAREMINGNTSI